MISKENKMSILAMRIRGESYKQVAEKLSLTINAVRAYCNRHGLRDEDVKDLSLCVNCGKAIHQSRHGGKKIYCSEKCRSAWRRKKGVLKQPVYHHICPQCGIEFDTEGNKKQRYCSRRCYYSSRKGDCNG